MLTPYQSVIRSTLSEFLNSEREVLKDQWWCTDVVDRYLTFVPAGKLFRGTLLLAIFEMLSEQDSGLIVPAGASVELMHSALLIHDDIIDRDTQRRGLPTFVTQYQDLAHTLKYRSSDHMGLSLAICAGDIGFFWGFKLIKNLEVLPERRARMLEFFAKEYTIVGMGEMLDIHQTASPKPVTEHDILDLYRNKTARYTFCLPMVMGAIAAGADAQLIAQIDALGEVIGILFQIKDDELGLFGTSAETGKASISDVREGKKTLYYHFVLQLASTSDQARLNLLFGKPDLTDLELDEVRAVVIASGARQLVDSYLEKYEKKALQLIAAMPLSAAKQDLLRAFVAENLLRRK